MCAVEVTQTLVPVTAAQANNTSAAILVQTWRPKCESWALEPQILYL